MKFAVIGMGVIGRIHAYVINQLEEAHLAVVMDSDSAKAEKAAEEFGCQWESEIGTVLRRPDVDAVSVCVPSGLHCQIAEHAAKAGKHVLLEKPMKVTLEAADRIIEICAKHQVQLGVVFQHRFDTAVQALKQTVERGELGKVHFASSRTCWYRDPLYYKGSWRGTLKLDGGGALINQSIHYIDLLQYIAGEVEWVCGRVDTLRHRSIEGEDTGCALLRLKSGAMGTIEGTTLAFGDKTTELNIFGEKGSVRIENDKTKFFAFQGETPLLYRQGTEDKEELIFENVNVIPHKRQYQDFCAALSQNRSPLVDGLEARKSLAIIQAIYQSSQTGKWIPLASL